MQKTYKFRLYPARKQEEKLLSTLDTCRRVYNKMLEELNKQKCPNRLALQSMLPEMKKQNPELNSVYSKTLQHEPYRLFSNLRALAVLKKNGRKVGRLRFKSKGRFKTFTYNQSGFVLAGSCKRCSILRLSKIGDIPIRSHRYVKGKVKQVIVKHTLSGKWFAMIVAEYEYTAVQTTNSCSIGIDLGLSKLVHDSEGNAIAPPKFLNRSLAKLAREQRALSKKKKGSANRAKQRIKVARVHEKVLNQRNDFLHKLSCTYVDSYGLIAVESLDIRAIVAKSYNARSLMDASWGKFISMLEYKAESAGVQVVKVDARNTSQECSSCGRVVPKTLWERVHKCTCGLEIDRDHNAARNILKRALGQELPDSKPVETGPLPVGQAKSVKQEAPLFERSSKLQNRNDSANCGNRISATGRILAMPK